MTPPRRHRRACVGRRQPRGRVRCVRHSQSHTKIADGTLDASQQLRHFRVWLCLVWLCLQSAKQTHLSAVAAPTAQKPPAAGGAAHRCLSRRSSCRRSAATASGSVDRKWDQLRRERRAVRTAAWKARAHSGMRAARARGGCHTHAHTRACTHAHTPHSRSRRVQVTRQQLRHVEDVHRAGPRHCACAGARRGVRAACMRAGWP